MTLDLDTLFPEGLTDDTASAISDFLNELAVAWESRYLHQLQRYHAQHQSDLFDPEQPWRTTPTD
jgi:hypothetical protein